MHDPQYRLSPENAARLREDALARFLADLAVEQATRLSAWSPGTDTARQDYAQRQRLDVPAGGLERA